MNSLTLKWIALIILALLAISCFSMEDTLKNAKNKPEIIKSWITSLKGQYPSVKSVSAQELKKMLTQSDRPVYLIDHRNLEEQMVSIIPGATPSRDINLQDLPANARVVVYCTIGARSSQYVQDQSQTNQGSEREIYNLAGGILAWTFVQGELQNPQKQSTKKVHVFGPAYHVVAEGYEGVTEAPKGSE